MAKPESWLKRNIVPIVAASIAALGVAVVWHNGNKPTPPTPPAAQAPMTATATSGGAAVNATSGANVQIGPSAAGQAASAPAAKPTPTAAGTPGAMHASANTGGTAVNAAGSAQVTVHKAPTASKP